MERTKLGTARVDERNRIYIPTTVVEKLKLKAGEFLSFELDKDNCICLFKGHLRIIRNANSCNKGGNGNGSSNNH